MNDPPFFSIIIPAFNGETFLEECADSVRRQTCEDWQCILVDDGSIDSTGQMMARYARSCSQFVHLSRPNGGSSAARNTALSMASGRWFYFLDCDDYLYPEALQTLRAAAMNRPDIRIVAGLLDGDSLPAHVAASGSLVVVDAFAAALGLSSKQASPLLQCAAFERTLVECIGAFDEALPTSEDREFIIRATAQSFVHQASRPIAFYRHVPGRGKSDRHLESGLKLQTARSIYRGLDTSMLRPLNRDAATFERWRACCLALIDCAEALEAESPVCAARGFERLYNQCEDWDELSSAVSKLIFFLNHPASAPRQAAQKCLRYFRTLLELSPDLPNDVHGLLERIVERFQHQA